MSAFPAQVSKQVSKMGADAANPHVEIRTSAHRRTQVSERLRTSTHRAVPIRA